MTGTMFVTLAFSLLVSTVAFKCQSGWLLQDDRCFHLSQDRRNWNDARTNCQSYGGDLAAILTRYDEEFLTTYVNIYGAHSDSFFVGGNDIETEGVWKWSLTGQRITDFENWSSGEPNDYGGNEDCLHLFKGSPGWNDLPCSQEHRYICEKFPE